MAESRGGLSCVCAHRVVRACETAKSSASDHDANEEGREGARSPACGRNIRTLQSYVGCDGGNRIRNNKHGVRYETYHVCLPCVVLPS